MRVCFVCFTEEQTGEPLTAMMSSLFSVVVLFEILLFFFTDIRESYVVLSRVRCGEIFGLMLQMVRPHLCSWTTWDQTEPQSSDESNFCLLHRSFSPTNMLLMSSNESCTSAGTAVWILGGSDTKSHTHRVELCVRVFVRLLFLFPGSADPVFVHRGC